MEWKEIEGGGGRLDSFWKPQKDESLEGRYIEKRNEQGKFKQSLYVIEMQDGQKVGVNGTTVLDKKMDKVGTGKMVKITFKGLVMGDEAEYKDWRVFEGIDYPDERV